MTNDTRGFLLIGPGGRSWADTYSVGDRCYCETTFDHNIGEIEVETPVGVRTVLQICEAIGPGPGSQPVGEDARPIYNDIQCGNGPANDAGDEDDCPGRVDIGREGCGHIGPRWNLSLVEKWAGGRMQLESQSDGRSND